MGINKSLAHRIDKRISRSVGKRFNNRIKKDFQNRSLAVNQKKIGVTGFEPATSWSQTRRSSQAEPHPDIVYDAFDAT